MRFCRRNTTKYEFHKDDSPLTVSLFHQGGAQSLKAVFMVLSQITENRKVEARKSLIFRHTVFTFSLKNATLRQNLAEGRHFPARCQTFGGARQVPARLGEPTRRAWP